MPLSNKSLGIFLIFGLAAIGTIWGQEGGNPWRAAAASVEITPKEPVRLSGYGSRTTAHESVSMPLHAKALALSWNQGPPIVFLTVDNCGVPYSMRQFTLLQLRTMGLSLADERFALHSSHTHCAPVLPGVLPFLFGSEMSAEETAAIKRYADFLQQQMVAVVARVLRNLKPALVDFSQGSVSFATNRRLKSGNSFTNSPNFAGPTDHALPVIRVRSASGSLLAIYTSYACHCTTLGFNQVHPDWAGCAQAELELRFPGVVAMTAIGCGGDQNPNPRREVQYAQLHGTQLGKEVVRLINRPMQVLQGPVDCRSAALQLPYDKPPTQEEFEARASQAKGQIGRHARHFLSLLKRGEALPKSLPYTVQAWSFSNQLLMVQLPGEVVVDYSLRLKREHGPQRTWVNGYTNDVPCYIPSQRVWEEGGYEAASAMTYYGRPTRFAPGVEEIIFKGLSSIIPSGFRLKEP
jgi:hypothetical protein